MPTAVLAEPILLPEYVKRARKLFGEHYASKLPEEWTAAKKLAQFIKSVDRLFTDISDGLPKSDIVIEEVTIRGREVVVRYNSPDCTGDDTDGTLNECHSVAVNSFNILRLSDGRVIEHLKTVYQIKPSIETQQR